jgi:3-oxoacyl-[acyl-carrier-protein] synthase II
MTTSTRRVVITGVGFVCPLGNSLESLWTHLTEGTSGVRQLRSIPAEPLKVPFAAEAWDFTGHINDFGPLEKDQKKSIRKGLKAMCREIQMGVAAAQLAIGHCGIAAESVPNDRTGVVYGSDYMMTLPDDFVDGVTNCMDDERQFHFDRWATDGLPKVEPLWLLKYLPNMPASYIAIYNDFRGPNNSITLREASANLAVGEAFHIIERGSADIMVAGATGTRVHPLRSVHIALQEELADGDDPAKLCRPFDKNRCGMVLGEGAGAVVLEEYEGAKARGAAILGEVIGAGSSSVMDRQGVAQRSVAMKNAMQQALSAAGVQAGEVGHLHAHGLGTRQGDKEEAAAISETFDGVVNQTPVVAAKSYFGNLGAGSGVVELAASLRAMQAEHLFPVLNYETPDPDCPINAVTASDVPAGDSFLSVNATPQGQASAIVVRRAN